MSPPLPTPRALSGLVAACSLLACAASAAAHAATPGTVDLQGRAVSADAEAAADARTGETLAGPGDRLVVVRYARTVDDEVRAELAATGARIVTYLADDAYLVHTDAGSAPRLARLVREAPGIDAAFVLDGADKLPPGFPGRGRVRVAVQTLAGEDGAGARTRVADAGQLDSAATAIGPYRTQVVTIDAAAARGLAGDPGVVALERDGTPVPLDERQGLIMADGALGSGPGAGYLAAHDAAVGTSTYPFAVDVMDSAFGDGTDAPADPDLRVGGVASAEDRVAYVHKATADSVDPPSWQACDGHGSINASIVAGYGAGEVADADGFRYGLGIAPRARVGGTTIFGCNGDFLVPSGVTFTKLESDSYLDGGDGYAGARVGSNSWGVSGREGEYTRYAQEYDAIVRDAVPAQAGNQEMVQVFAAGNDGPGAGSITPPATAKNVIAVGASESVRPFGVDSCLTPDSEADDPQDVPDFTSRGPTDDGRLKPDLVAPGTHIAGSVWRDTPSPYDGTGVCGAGSSFGAPFAGAPGYTASTGTSHSTPAVAALAAAARVTYEREHGSWPSAAMVKAMLVAGATPLGGAGAGEAPNPVQGHGLARLGSVSTAGRVLTDQDVVLRDSADNVWRETTVADEGRPVTATLVWTDAPGPLLGAAQVNDLDLEILAGGVLYRGNNLDAGLSAPGGTADRLNNVERVVLPAGVSGPVIARVRAATIAGDGVPGGIDPTDQDFALILDNLDVPEGAVWYGVPDPPSPPSPPAPPPEPQPAAQAPAVSGTPAPTQQPKAKPGLRVLGAPSAKRCLTVGGAKLRVKGPPGMRLTSISVLVDRRLRARSSGARMTSTLRVRFTRRRAHTIRIVARTSARTTLSWVRSYRACSAPRTPTGTGGSGGAAAPDVRPTRAAAG